MVTFIREASGLLVCWISGLFLVTAVKSFLHPGLFGTLPERRGDPVHLFLPCLLNDVSANFLRMLVLLHSLVK